MKIKQVPLELVNQANANTMMEHLGITVTEIGEDYIKGQMPVDHRTHQPLGRLHGGASVSLIESLGSIGSSLMVDLNVEFPVGIEVNANHVGGATEGVVEAVARLIHGGRKTHVWAVEVSSLESGKLISSGRLTVMIVQKNG